MTLSNYLNSIAGTDIDFCPPKGLITKDLRAGPLPADTENRP